MEPADAGDLAADDAARRAAATAAATAWHQVVVLKGARTVIAEPDGTATVAPFENPALASGGTGDVLAGIIGALLAQGLRPAAAARLGVYLHGTAGDLVRERLGDAGLLASDLPDAVPLVRKRLAAIAERSRSGNASSGSPVATPPAGATRPAPERLDAGTVDRGSARGRRPAAAAAHGVGGDRPRRARRQPCRPPAPRRHRARPSIRWSRPTPTVTALIPVARALEAAGADGLCVAAFDEAVALRRAGIARPILVLYPIPPALAGAAARDRHRRHGWGPRPARRGCWPRSEPTRRRAARSPARGRDRARPRRLRRARGSYGRHGRRRGRRASGSSSAWTHFQAPADAHATAAQVAAFERATDDLVANGIPLAAAARRGERRAAARGRRQPRRRAARASPMYGLLPDELLGGRGAAARSRARPSSDPRSRSTRGPSGSPSCRPGWGISYGPSFTTSRPSRIATLPLGYGDGWPRSLSNRAGALVRGGRVPLVGNVAMDAVMADVTDVPGPPVGVGRRVRADRGPGRRADHGCGARRGSGNDLLGGRHEPLRAAASGVPCGLRSAGDADRSSTTRIEARRSKRP